MLIDLGFISCWANDEFFFRKVCNNKFVTGKAKNIIFYNYLISINRDAGSNFESIVFILRFEDDLDLLIVFVSG